MTLISRFLMSFPCTIFTSGICRNRTSNLSNKSTHLTPHLCPFGNVTNQNVAVYGFFTTFIVTHDHNVTSLSRSSLILASLHACVPTGTSLEQWEQIERTLQHCFQAYGISHVTISPELQCSKLQSLNGLQFLPAGGCNRLTSHDDYGCSVNELKRQKVTGV